MTTVDLERIEAALGNILTVVNRFRDDHAWTGEDEAQYARSRAVWDNLHDAVWAEKRAADVEAVVQHSETLTDGQS